MINLEDFSDTAALIGRLFLSSMFLLFGYGKLTGYAGTVAYMGSLGHCHSNKLAWYGRAV